MTKVEKQCEEFNAKYPHGAVVSYWRGVKEGPPSGTGKMKYGLAQPLGGHTAVVYVEGNAGCICLSHIEVVEALPAAER